MTKQSSWIVGGVVLALAGAPGCGGGGEPPVDAGGGGTDAGTTPDAGGGTDAGVSEDAGPAPVDAFVAPDAPETPDAGPTISTFRIGSLDTTGCATVDHDALTGDDRGGLALSGANVIVSGDDASARFDLDLGAGTRLARPDALVGTFRDTMVSDVGSNRTYLLLGDTGPLFTSPFGRSDVTVTRLVPMTSAGDVAATGALTLSTPIAIPASAGIVGLFSGRGQVGVYDGTSLFVISTATGAVTNAGAVTLDPPSSCENWAFWGLLERVGSASRLVYRADSGSNIVRVDVPSGAVTTLATFTDLSDLCSFAASPSTSQWFWHHEGSSQFSPSTSEALGFCEATYDLTGTDFSVVSLGSATCDVIEVDALVGDDRGGVAVSDGFVFLSGDAGLGRTTLPLAEAATSRDFLFDALLTNLATETMVSLATDDGLLGATGGMVTRVVTHDAEGLPTSTAITLSTPIALPGDSAVGLFSGWNELLIHDGSNAFRIALPSGEVTDLGAMPAPSHTGCETWAYWGVAENDGTAWSLVAVDGNEVARYAVPAGTREVVGTFTDLSDMCTFSVSETQGRWYFHHETTSQFTTDPAASETLGYCAATVTHP